MVSVPENLGQLYRINGISDIVGEIIYNQGIDDQIKLKTYLEPSFSDLSGSYMFKDMGKAVSLITDTINNGGKILVYGDYDVDGVCALSIVSMCLTDMGANVLRFVPDRKKDGYGLNMRIAQMIVSQGVSLVITVDNGIAAAEEIDYLRSNGVRVIVTDHHEPGDVLPTADALLDAKCADETYPYKELCGAGVALQLARALTIDAYDKYMDLAALATVADVVPLTGENRNIVKLGLKKINETMPLWTKSIKRVCPNISEVTPYHLGYVFGPMINACGRIANAKIAIEFMAETEESESIRYAIQIKELNDKRKTAEDAVLRNISCDNNHNIIIAAGPYEQGVVGLAASRITDKYYKPSIIFSYDPVKHIYTGSGRSIDGVNLFELVGRHKGLTEKFGGHKMAIGVSVAEDKFDMFVEALYSEFDALDNEMFKRVYYYTDECLVNDLGSIYGMSALEPVGYQAPSVKILLNQVKFEKLKFIAGHTDSFIAQVSQNHSCIEVIAYHTQQINPNILYNIVIDPQPFKEGMYRVLAIEPAETINTEEPKANSAMKAEEAKVNENEAGTSLPVTIPDENYGSRTIPLSLETLGISEKKIAQFNKAGIFNSDDLVNYFPKRYMDFRKTVLSSEIKNGEMNAIIGVVRGVRSSTGSNNCTIITCTCEDQFGQKFSARWFNQAYVAKMITEGSAYIFCGTGYVGDKGYPSINVLYFNRDISKLQTLVPVYKKIPGMSNDFLTNSIKTALDRLPLSDYLEKSVVDDFGLINQSSSVRLLHSPHSETDIAVAQRRKVFDSLFRFNFIIKHNRQSINNSNDFVMSSMNSIPKFSSLLPYELTNDQKSTIINLVKEMRNDTTSVNALIQGDVGCGKTIVAYFLCAVAAENGFQSCIAAPTEVLARQHYNGLVPYAEQMGLRVALLTGTVKAREKKDICAALADGQIDILIGTHAIFQPTVKFQNLSLAIIDEQHKFGVEQRNTFLNSEHMPHIITMSATPIPRTLAMATFGDNISVYNIKTKPAGRKDVITIRTDSDNQTYEFILNEIRKGHQAYIVCPLIDESEKLDSVDSVKASALSAVKYFSRFPDIKISDISGRMKQELISEEIDKFKNNETQILISTTIIEVGVDVPNATVIAIKNSERFGLAQIHQLRGRVGRGSEQSYCLLQTADTEDEKADILCKNNDGFEIAKEDMRLRGTGDFIGTVQSGANKDVMLMISEPDLYKRISELNDKIYSDPARIALYDFLLG